MISIPRAVIAEDDDVSAAIRSALKLHGFEAWKTKSTEEFLTKVKEIEGRVDVVIINGAIASDRNAMVIIKIKRINTAIKVLVVAERHEVENKITAMDYGADEFVLKPLTADSIADKVTMLLVETAGLARR